MSILRKLPGKPGVQRIEYHRYTRGVFDKFLEQLQQIAGTLILGQKVVIFSIDEVSSNKMRDRLRDARLFELIPIEEIKYSPLRYKLKGGGSIEFQFHVNDRSRENRLRGFSGQVIVEEITGTLYESLDDVPPMKEKV